MRKSMAILDTTFYKGTDVYSDGDEAENRILEIVREGKTLNDLETDEVSWPTLYHLSPVRENICNWYPFRKDSRILEIGAGCGAITGALCRSGAEVCSVDLSLRRSTINYERHKEYENLRLIVGNLNDVVFDELFDYVILNGVLEYAGRFTEGEDPYRTFLENIRKYLKPEGKLLLAIENRLGLKYFAGAEEDHLGKIYAGIRGYNPAEGIRTFSKSELTQLLERSGFTTARFYYPYPDYKFPLEIFTDKTLKDFHYGKLYQVFDKDRTVWFPEEAVASVLAADGAAAALANSFLVEAGGKAEEQADVLYVKLNIDRNEAFRTGTIIRNENGKKTVEKFALTEAAEQHLKTILANEKKMQERQQVIPGTLKNDRIVYPFATQKTLETILKEAIAANDRERVKTVFDLLHQLIAGETEEKKYTGKDFETWFGSEKTGKESAACVCPANIDLMPDNVFFEDGNCTVTDCEWITDFPVPAAFLLWRMTERVYSANLQLNDVLNQSFLFLEYGITQEEISIYRKWNWHFENEYVAGRNGNRFAKKVSQAQTDPASAEKVYGENEHLRQDLVNKEGHINQLMDNERELKQAVLNKESHISQLMDNERELKQAVLNKEGHINQLMETERELKQMLLNKEGHISQLMENERELKQAVLNKENDISEIRQMLLNKEGHISQLMDNERELKQTLVNKEGHIQQLIETERNLKQENLNKEGHIAQLIESERRLQGEVNSLNEQLQVILNSHSWKLMAVPRKVFGKLLPKGGKGRECLKRAVHVVHKPKPVALIEQVPSEEERIWETEGILELPCSKHPQVSIVIPVYNQFHYTYACLKSIWDNSGDVPYEVIIADDCSTDATAQIGKYVTGVKVVRNKENLRFLRNCNHAAEKAKGKYILFLNNDTQVRENWLEPLVRLIESDEKIGMVGSKLVYPDGRLQEAGGILWKDGSAWNYGHGKNPEDPEFNYVKEADYISGAAIMIRSDLWKQLGGFDDRFAPAYYEDTDLAFMVREAGYLVKYQPQSVVVHFEGVSNGTDTSSGLKAYQVENQKKFFQKWQKILEAEHDPNGENVFKAKDRSQRKTHILVVDHYVPMFDKDAGGRCTYMYLKLFVSMGFKVTFIGDNFFPHQPYTSILNQMGIEVLYGDYYCLNWQNWLKENANQFDYIYLQRPHISIKYIDLVKAHSSAKIIYFAHDLHHVREQREYEITHDPKLLESAKEWKETEYKLFREADVGHVVGSYEQGVMQKAFPDKPVRNIPLYIYEQLPVGIEKDFSKRKDLLYVGGFGHHPNVDAVLWFGKEVLPKILEKYPDIIWHVVGSKPTDEIQAMAGKNVIVHGFVSDEELEQFYRNCRIAVVPLRYGAGVKGKVVEACYYQIPLVTTPIGAEGLSMEEKSMLVEEDAAKMAEMICGLYEDQQKLKELSDNCEAFIRNHFMLEEAERIIRLDIQPKENPESRKK